MVRGGRRHHYSNEKGAFHLFMYTSQLTQLLSSTRNSEAAIITAVGHSCDVRDFADVAPTPTFFFSFSKPSSAPLWCSACIRLCRKEEGRGICAVHASRGRRTPWLRTGIRGSATSTLELSPSLCNYHHRFFRFVHDPTPISLSRSLACPLPLLLSRAASTARPSSVHLSHCACCSVCAGRHPLSLSRASFRAHTPV